MANDAVEAQHELLAWCSGVPMPLSAARVDDWVVSAFESDVGDQIEALVESGAFLPEAFRVVLRADGGALADHRAPQLLDDLRGACGRVDAQLGDGARGARGAGAQPRLKRATASHIDSNSPRPKPLMVRIQSTWSGAWAGAWKCPMTSRWSAQAACTTSPHT